MPKGKEKPPAPKEQPKHHAKHVHKPEPEVIPIDDDTAERKPAKGHKFKKVLAPRKQVEGGWEYVEKREAYLVERPINTDSDEDSGDSELSD